MTNKPSTSRSNSLHVDRGAFTSRRACLALLTVVGVGAFAGTNATTAQAGGFDIGPVPTATVHIDLPIAQPEPQPQPNRDLPLTQPLPQPDPTPDFPIAQPTPGETDPTVDTGGPVPSSGETAGTNLPSTGTATGVIAALAAALTALGAAATFTTRRRSA